MEHFGREPTEELSLVNLIGHEMTIETRRRDKGVVVDHSGFIQPLL